MFAPVLDELTTLLSPARLRLGKVLKSNGIASDYAKLRRNKPGENPSKLGEDEENEFCRLT